MFNIWRLSFVFATILIHRVESDITPNKRKWHRGLHNKVAETAKIIGGYNTTHGRFPYYTALWNEQEQIINCGGSLIAPDVVLTAAHCWGSIYRIWVAEVGRYNLDNPEDDFESFKIVKYLPNPFYGVEAIFSSDFMLLLLDGNSSMPPLKTNRDEKVPQAGQNLTVVGLGADQDNFLDESFPTILQGATLNVVSNEECARTCETTTTGEVFTYDGSITNDSLCVWAPGKSYCFGDSGGPLIVQGRFPEEDVQSGIVSWLENCYSPIFPEVSARVSEATEWIDAHVCRYSQDPPAWFSCNNRTFPPDPILPTNPLLPGKTFPVTVEIDFDYSPFETWWFILNGTGHLVYIVPRYTYTQNDANSKVEQVLHLPVGQTYTFVIKDEGEDGILYPGGYEVRLGTKSNGEVLASDFAFDGVENRTKFTLSSSLTPQPTTSPTISEAPSVSPAPTLPVRAVTLTINFGFSQSYGFGYSFLNSAGVAINNAPIGSFGFDNITVEAIILLPKDEHFTFVFMSDGFILDQGNYSLVLGPPDAGGPLLIFSNGTFNGESANLTLSGYEETVEFFLPSMISAVPSNAPSRHPSQNPTSTPSPTGPLQALTLSIYFGGNDPFNYGYLLLNGRNRTVANETFGIFSETDPYALSQSVLHVPSEELYTFILLSDLFESIYPGNFSIALGLPGERGPVVAPNEDVNFFTSGEVISTSTFFVPSSFSAAPSMAPTSSSPVTLFIDFAGYPSEIGFSFLNEFQEFLVDAPFGTFGFANKTFQQTYDFLTGYQYTFVISDYFGDGRFPGKFSLKLGTPSSTGKIIVSQRGIKGFKEEFPFTLAATSPFSPVSIIHQGSSSPSSGPFFVVTASPTHDQTPVSSGAQFTTNSPSITEAPAPFTRLPTLALINETALTAPSTLEVPTMTPDMLSPMALKAPKVPQSSSFTASDKTTGGKGAPPKKGQENVKKWAGTSGSKTKGKGVGQGKKGKA